MPLHRRRERFERCGRRLVVVTGVDGVGLSGLEPRRVDAAGAAALERLSALLDGLGGAGSVSSDVLSGGHGGSVVETVAVVRGGNGGLIIISHVLCRRNRTLVSQTSQVLGGRDGRLVTCGRVVVGGGHCGSVVETVLRLRGRQRGAVTVAKVLGRRRGGTEVVTFYVLDGVRGTDAGDAHAAPESGAASVSRANALAVRLAGAALERRSHPGGVADAADVARETASETEGHTGRATDAHDHAW